MMGKGMAFASGATAAATAPLAAKKKAISDRLAKTTGGDDRSKLSTDPNKLPEKPSGDDGDK